MSKNRLDYTANLGRHSHDVTGGYASSLTTGPIVPQYFDILNPGEKIFYKTHMFCRSQKVTTAFLGEIDVHLDYFFVPLQMLYTAFGNVFAGTNDFISDFYAEYGDVGENFDLPVANLDSFFENQQVSWSTLTSQYCGENFLKGVFRLLDSLNINPLVCQRKDYEANNITIPHSVFTGFPAALLAYQAIYQKYFRNEDIEKFNVGAFNCDSLALDPNKTFAAAQFEDLLTLHYSGRPNDYFTTIRFSPIATSINSLGAGTGFNGDVRGGATNSFGQLISTISNFLGNTFSNTRAQNVSAAIGSQPSYNLNFGSVTHSNAVAPSATDDFTRFSVQNIRALFALDKYMRVYGRAGKTYDDQILAHFGVKVPHDVKHDLTHLKHYRMVLQSDPVISTADTETGAVGSVGGQVAAQLDTDEASFEAPVHGVFMCVARLIPRPRYFCTNDRLHNISNRISFPIAEFDKLGAQPIYELEYGYDSSGSFTGWKNRYSEFKEKYNRCSITFSHHLDANQGANFFSPWVVSQMPFGENGSNLRYPRFKAMFVQPNSLDNIMEVSYALQYPTDETMRTNPHIVLQTDPFLTEFACFVKKVSWMSPTGEPDL